MRRRKCVEQEATEFYSRRATSDQFVTLFSDKLKADASLNNNSLASSRYVNGAQSNLSSWSLSSTQPGRSCMLFDEASPTTTSFHATAQLPSAFDECGASHSLTLTCRLRVCLAKFSRTKKIQHVFALISFLWPHRAQHARFSQSALLQIDVFIPPRAHQHAWSGHGSGIFVRYAPTRCKASLIA